MDEDIKDQAYSKGFRDAYGFMLIDCLKNLGYDDPDAQKASWIMERETAISALREVCGEHGDNNWDEHLSLCDVITKHLGRHLDEREDSQA